MTPDELLTVAEDWSENQIKLKNLESQITSLQNTLNSVKSDMRTQETQLGSSVGGNISIKVYKLPRVPECVLVTYHHPSGNTAARTSVQLLPMITK